MAHPLPRAARLTLAGVKLAAVGTVVAAGLLGTGPATEADPPQPGYVVQPVDDRPDRVQGLLDAHDCSLTGFGTDQQPASALVRSARGTLRFVDFDTGWRIYTRHGAATLVAVCLDEPVLRS